MTLQGTLNMAFIGQAYPFTIENCLKTVEKACYGLWVRIGHKLENAQYVLTCHALIYLVYPRHIYHFCKLSAFLAEVVCNE